MKTLELMDSMDQWRGLKQPQRKNDPEYMREVARVMELIAGNDMPSHYREFALKEAALTTSDFPNLFGDILDRQLLAHFKEAPCELELICRPRIANDFRSMATYRMTDGDQILDEVEEEGEYQNSDRDENYDSYALKKYGRQFRVSWETMINDDLGAFEDSPQRLAMAARRTAERLISLQIMDSGGPKDGATTDLFHSSYSNTGTDDITIDSLEETIQAMEAKTNSSAPILNSPRFLMVSPSRKLRARAILNSINRIIKYPENDENGPFSYPMTNPVQYADDLYLIVNPWIPIICTSKPNSWFLFTDPKDLPCLEKATLRGHENPELFMKASDQVALGGAASGPMAGSFENDTIAYKVRYCYAAKSLVSTYGYLGCYGHAVD